MKVAGLGSSPASAPSPTAPPRLAVDWSLFGWIRRTVFNRPPTIRYDASLNAQDMSNGVITGNIGAGDPDRDRLTYTVVADPKYGTVDIDQLTGDFTFTPSALFAQFGGADAFTVKVSDGRFHLLSFLFSRDRGTPRARIAVPVTSLPDASPSSPLETFKVEKVIDFDVPEGVVVTGADLTPDGEHLLLEVKIDGKTQIAVSNLDGGDYQCISCGVVTNAAKARVLEDNQRIWFANTSGQQSADDPLGGAGLISYAMLECEGSVYSCGSPTVKNVEFPSDRGPLATMTQNREAKPDPFGEYVTWTENTPVTGPRMSIARLVATEDGYTLVDQRIFSPQWDEDTEYAADFANATRFYEGASWHAGGRYLKYQTTTTGLNYDIWLLDTATGERRQLTTDLDYNESGDISPDGESIYFSSARGADRMDVFTALVRPSLLDVAAFPQIGRVSLWNNRRAMNEPWVMSLDEGQQLDGYSGQPIIIDPDWTIRGWSWFPDSTRALINEQQRPDTVTPGAPDTPWRFSIISFPSREATTPLAPVHQDPEAIAMWSVPVEEYNPMMGRQEPSRVLKGKYSGTATLQYSGAFAGGSYSVTYENYSDDGKTFINGTEQVTVVNPIGNATWSADLTSTGERTGYLKGSIKAGKANAFTGTVSSEINGVTYTGVPIQTDFPVMEQPQLAISSFDNRVRVTATVAEDGYPRAVRGATVTVGATTVTTDEHGYAQIAFAPGDTVTVDAGGFRSASQQVPLT
ncbi:Ig-like domain-containing protein [Mycobacterium pinniadriaticum]|nr:Ig-like domain-containing protein [Mycobacterium pinniadriaticum]